MNRTIFLLCALFVTQSLFSTDFDINSLTMNALSIEQDFLEEFKETIIGFVLENIQLQIQNGVQVDLYTVEKLIDDGIGLMVAVDPSIQEIVANTSPDLLLSIKNDIRNRIITILNQN